MAELTPADLKKKEADARKAEADAAKAEKELAEWESILAKSARDAALKTSIADAEKSRVTSLIPSLSGVETGETKVSGNQPALAPALSRKALEEAAANVVEKLSVSDTDKILITSDPDLVSSDAVYLEVNSGLDALIRRSKAILSQFDSQQGLELALVALAPVIAGVANALPGLMSLFTANRTLSSFAIAPDSLAAVAAVGEHLLQKSKVQLDDFRLVEGGAILKKEEILREERLKLAELKFELEKSAQESASCLSYLGDVITAIDAFLSSLRAIPKGSTRSPFAIAALRQQLHTENLGNNSSDPFSKLLFIESSGGTADQLINDRPFGFKDKLHSYATISITYWLMDRNTSDIISSGVETGIAQISGSVGKTLNFKATS